MLDRMMTLFPAVSQEFGLAGLALAIAAAFAAGLARGFSGFGVGLVFMPVGAAVFGPKLAVAALLVFDLVVSVSTTLRRVKFDGLRPLLPIWTGLTIATPFGALAAAHFNPVSVRWFVTGFIACVVALLTSGKQLRIGSGAGRSFAAGIAGGFMGGLAALNGIVVVTYWLSTGMEPRTLRANLLTVFCLTSIATIASFAFAGMLTAEVFRVSLVLVVPYAVGSLAGTALFPLASPKSFRSIVYAMIAASMIIGMPVWDTVIGR
jgi:uncharacterized membrane protein YfcA